MSEAVATVDAGILERAGVKVTPTSLTLTNRGITYEQIEELFGFVGTVEQSCFWWTADLLNAAEDMYGEVFAQLESATGLAAQTLTNRASVGRRIPPERRRAHLRPSVHCEVAYLSEDEQEGWLDRAEENGWSRSELRDRIRGPREPRDSWRSVVEMVLRQARPNGDGSWVLSGEAYAQLCATVGYENG